MSKAHQVIVYGSYGYTGKLIIEECRRKNLEVLLSGRDATQLQQQSDETGYPFTPADINNHDSLVDVLKQGRLLIHCAGPFQFTARQMIEACLEAGIHYTDITGEIQVFELLATYNARAKAKGIVIMPGTGFDVVPTDCLAVFLRNKLPDATHLQLAFTQSKGQFSRGTAKTAIEGLGHGTIIRENGKLKEVPMGQQILTVNFGGFTSKTVCIPWGDVSTAYQSTGIPNIEVYTGMPGKMIRLLRLARLINPLLKTGLVKNFLRRRVDSGPAGPDQERREKGRSFLWGKVWNGRGDEAEARLETPGGYLLTAKTATLAAEKLLRAEVRPGFATPAQYFGADFILEIPTTTRA